MAVITLKQLLHRPSPGAAIDSSNPLEVQLYASGNPVSVATAEGQTTTQGKLDTLAGLIGALNATKETDPDAASATLLALVRGLLSAGAKESTLSGLKTLLDNGTAKVQLSGRKAVPKTKIVSVSTTLNAGNAENIDVVADAGKIWTIMAMYIQVPAVQGASSGTHRVQVLTTAGASAFPALLNFQNAYNGALSYQYMTIRASDGNNDIPDDIAAQGQAIRGFVISPTLGLRINYMNSTNGNQTGARVVHLIVLEEDLVA